MRLASTLILAFTFGAICAIPQAELPKPKFRPDTPSDEQLAVYRAVFNNYMMDSRGSLNLSRQTFPVTILLPVTEGCVNGFKLEQTNNSVRTDTTVHTFTTAPAPNIVLVDPQPQIDERKRAAVWPDLSLSEIVFDKGHRHAVVGYGDDFGPTTGSGTIVVLEKTGNRWKITKACANYFR